MSNTKPNMKDIARQLSEHAATLAGHHEKCRRRIADLEAEAAEIKRRPLSRADYLATVKASLQKQASESVHDMARRFKSHLQTGQCTVEDSLHHSKRPARSADGYMTLSFGRPLDGLPNDPVFHGQIMGIIAAGVASVAELAVATIGTYSPRTVATS